jgi:hypothetical protein
VHDAGEIGVGKFDGAAVAKMKVSRKVHRAGRITWPGG